MVMMLSSTANVLKAMAASLRAEDVMSSFQQHPAGGDLV